MAKPDDIPQSDWDASLSFKSRVDASSMSAQEFVARAMMAAREEEREAILKVAENFDTGCRPESAPADYVDGYDAGVDDFSVFFSQTIRNRKGA